MRYKQKNYPLQAKKKEKTACVLCFFWKKERETYKCRPWNCMIDEIAGLWMIAMELSREADVVARSASAIAPAADWRSRPSAQSATSLGSFENERTDGNIGGRRGRTVFSSVREALRRGCVDRTSVVRNVRGHPPQRALASSFTQVSCGSRDPRRCRYRRYREGDSFVDLTVDRGTSNGRLKSRDRSIGRSARDFSEKPRVSNWWACARRRLVLNIPESLSTKSRCRDLSRV